MTGLMEARRGSVVENFEFGRAPRLKIRKRESLGFEQKDEIIKSKDFIVWFYKTHLVMFLE